MNAEGLQAVILCGGFGTRLKEETEFRPKPMIRLGPRPILWYIMKHYAVHGVRDFVLALGYKGESIKDYFYHYELFNSDITLELGRMGALEAHSRHDENGWRVTLVDTGLETLKGGRLKRVERYLTGETFFVTYGDGVSDVDIFDTLRFHRAHGKLATVVGVNAAARFGELKIDGDVVTSFVEKPSHASEFISGGFFVFERGLLDHLTEDNRCDLEYGALDKVARDGEMRVFRHHGYWACMDTQRDVDYLNEQWRTGDAPWVTW